MFEKIFERLHGDKTIWVLAFLFALISIVTVYSFIPILVAQHGGSPTTHLIKHAIILSAGMFVMYYTHKLDVKYFSRLAQIMLWTSFVLLFLTLIVGNSVNGAKRWLSIPIINQGFQTSDFAKLAIILYTSRMLVIKKDILDNFKEGIWPILWPILLTCALIFPQDFSTAAMLFMICVMLLFVGRVPFKYVMAVIGGVVLLGTTVILFALANPGTISRVDTWKNRVEAYNSGDDKEAAQLKTAQRAIANGGWFGVGPGKGIFKKRTPQAYADFYFASFIEELGLLGGGTLIFVFLLLLYRSFKIAVRTDKFFGALVVVGLSISMTLQAIINMAVPTEIVPVTGQNMPMLGLGGTAILFTCISFGIILSISRTVYKEERQEGNEIKEEENENKLSENLKYEA